MAKLCDSEANAHLHHLIRWHLLLPTPAMLLSNATFTVLNGNPGVHHEK